MMSGSESGADRLGKRLGQGCRADHREIAAGNQGGEFPPRGALHADLGLEIPGLYRLPEDHLLPRARAKICDLAVEKISRYVGYEAIQAVAGGETAGIPFAAWIAERMGAPMAYIRKQPKGFGRNALIEGDVPENMNTLLVEDLTTDGGSKIQFAKALREAGAICNHTFVVFYYGVFPGSFETLASMDIALHHLCTWWDVLEAAKDQPYFSDSALAGVRKFLENPMAWSAAHGGVGTAEEALAHKMSKIKGK